MKKTTLLSTILAGSFMAFAAVGCSHDNKDTTTPNAYGQTNSQTLTPDQTAPPAGGMEPGVGNRQNVNGTDPTSPIPDSTGNTMTPASPDMNQGTRQPTNTPPNGMNGTTTPGGTATPVK